MTSLCQGLRRSAGSGGEDPENQVENSKESWQFINELLNKNSKICQIREINFDGKTVTKDEEIAAGFNVTIELTFAGINMFLARLRIILARA